MDSLKIEGLSNRLEIGTDQLGRMQERKEMNGLSMGSGQAAGSPPSGSFTQMLEKAVEQANEHQVQADTAAKELMAGRSKNIHESLLVLERADTSLKLMMQVRNKVLDAYREIMRMQV
ncbi:MAG: flagellar hook-basal body complex protein FliE [Xanthomonadaceae bacterium]|nr:flagellar hook-basal body complex protein FliE [Xanthomonadaceae bacterium]